MIGPARSANPFYFGDNVTLAQPVNMRLNRTLQNYIRIHIRWNDHCAGDAMNEEPNYKRTHSKKGANYKCSRIVRHNWTTKQKNTFPDFDILKNQT